MTYSIPTPTTDLQQTIKQAGVSYWRRLMQQGIPKEEARQIAAAIAKFDLVQRIPTLEQRHLIETYSAAICRAHLWRSHLLLAQR